MYIFYFAIRICRGNKIFRKKTNDKILRGKLLRDARISTLWRYTPQSSLPQRRSADDGIPVEGRQARRPPHITSDPRLPADNNST